MVLADAKDIKAKLVSELDFFEQITDAIGLMFKRVWRGSRVVSTKLSIPICIRDKLVWE